MEIYLPLFFLVPLAGFFLSLMFANRKEMSLYIISITTISTHLLAVLGYTIAWYVQGMSFLELKSLTFYKKADTEIFLDFYFDHITAVFALLGALITLLVAIFSKFYLHRDSGFKRFFTTLLLFYTGYQLVVFSGNFETLFIGWEYLGITSFLLIAFYRDRYLPVKNALKTISIYRLGDICLVLCLWMNHNIWHQNITFPMLLNEPEVAKHIEGHPVPVIFILGMLVMAAVVKSAQFPFSSWLTRAMEGPTSSSAVFYGSLSVHLGVFLLLRTFPYWQHVTEIRGLVIFIGIITIVVCSGIARVQSTVKTQIAYSSIAQIGFMFIEVAMGWHVLALVHMVGNALLRTYQLLVSPSVLNYLIHQQFYSYTPRPAVQHDGIFHKWRNTFYMLNIKEWNMDVYLKKLLWDPAKWLGNAFRALGSLPAMVLLLVLLAGGILSLFQRAHWDHLSEYGLPLCASALAFLLTLVSFRERRSPLMAWLQLASGQGFLLLGITFNSSEYGLTEFLCYISGLLVAFLLGCYCLQRIRNREQHFSLNAFLGHVHEYPFTAFLFLLSCLAFLSLPFTPSFIGFDLLFTYIGPGQAIHIAFTALTFLVLELAVLRIYARVFLGPHIKHYHPVAYRSS